MVTVRLGNLRRSTPPLAGKFHLVFKVLKFTNCTNLICVNSSGIEGFLDLFTFKWLPCCRQFNNYHSIGNIFPTWFKDAMSTLRRSPTQVGHATPLACYLMTLVFGPWPLGQASALAADLSCWTPSPTIELIVIKSPSSPSTFSSEIGRQ